MDDQIFNRIDQFKGKKSKMYGMLLHDGFSVRRTDVPFSSVGVDMALEQTINAVAKHRLKGIIDFADVSSAVNRWLVTSSMRSQIVNKILDIADLSSDDGKVKNKETSNFRIARDGMDKSTLAETICGTLNPFGANLKTETLFNIIQTVQIKMLKNT